MYEALPKNDRTFYVDVEGADTGQKYEGTFTVRCLLDMGGRHAEELEKTRLLADYANPSNGLYGIAITLSKLRARIIDGPEWWKQSAGGTSILDENVILHLYDECLRLEQEWRADLKKQADKAAKAPEKPEEEKPPVAAAPKED